MKQARIIKVDGTIIPVSPANGTDFSLEEMYKIIGMDGRVPDPCVQIVQLASKDEILVCEDNGLMHGLPTNREATMYCCMDVHLSSRGIVGDVLICDNSHIL